MKKMTDFELFVLEKGNVDCSDVVKLFGSYVDEELPGTLRARVSAHVATCPKCRDFEKSYRSTIDLAAELRDKPVPLEVQNRLRRALNQKLGLNLPMVD